jgi:hypothetical protein
MDLLDLTELSGVYQVSIGNTVYIGQSRDCVGRAKQHVASLRRGKHQSKRLQEAYDANPTISIVLLERCNSGRLDDKELEWIHYQRDTGKIIANQQHVATNKRPDLIVDGY